MDLLKQKIRENGVFIGTDIVKVDMFLNHQIDIRLLEEMGKEFIYYYKHYHMVYKGEQIAFKVFDRHEKTDYGSNLENICKALSDKGLSINRYQVEKMLEMNLLNLKELA